MRCFKWIGLVLMAIVLLFGQCVVSFGNSAEPPSIIIIVPNAPDTLKLAIGTAKYNQNRVEDKIVENYYIFYVLEFNERSTYDLNVELEGERFDIPIEDLEQHFNNVYTLNLDKRSLTKGKLPLRSILLIVLRVGLTLMIEGLIFWLFGFRQKASWLAFLVINLVTQGALNIWISTMPVQIGYGIIVVFLFEVLIVVVEMTAFISVLKEHSKLRRGLYAFFANAVSLVAGLIIITSLPI